MMDRRAFLRRAGAAALALPLLQLPRRAYGQLDPGFPHRLLVFFTPNGTKKELWSPKQEHGDTRERGYTMGSLLRPLLPFQDRMVLFDGIDLAVAAEGPGGPHQRGMASLLTGAVITEGDFVGGDGRRAGWGGGISIDQLIARHLQPATRLTTFELGVRVLESLPRARMIYGGPEQPLPPENDPVVAFTRAFEGVDADPAVMRRRLLRRQSVLDAVKGDFRDLQSRVSRVDREKLERHAEALRDLERRLAVVAEQPGLCQGEAPQREADVMAQGAYATLLDQQADIVVNALACDVTRVASLQCSSAVNALRFPHLPVGDYEGHALSHMGDGSEIQQDWEGVLGWYAEQFAQILRRLDAVPEGDGTLLDHTFVLWVNELSRGNTHSHLDMPFILAGGGKAGLSTGRYLRYDGVPHNDLLVSIAHLMQVPIPTFGDPRFCNGPLVGL